MSQVADQVLRAFLEVFSKAEGHVTFRQRGGSPGYVHIVPARWDPTKTRNRHVAVELKNGTVALTDELAEKVGASLRPGVSIQEDPLGHSAGPRYGRFRWAITHDAIMARWNDERAFAQEVREHLLALDLNATVNADEGDYD